MSRGGPVKRTRTISVRVTPEEWAEWDARREDSGRKEMGAWVRAVVTQAHGRPLLPEDFAPSSVTVPDVNWDAYRVLGLMNDNLYRMGHNLNQIARKLNMGKQDPDLPSVIAQLRHTAALTESTIKRLVGQ